jgi:hypothetical protein
VTAPSATAAVVIVPTAIQVSAFMAVALRVGTGTATVHHVHGIITWMSFSTRDCLLLPPADQARIDGFQAGLGNA